MNIIESKIEIEGRSLLLNIVAIFLNVIGVYFITKGFHVSSGDSAITFKIIGFSLFFIGVLGLYALKGMYMFSFVARSFVGGLFIVSGLVKANDPWGFAFKLEEYFSPMGLAYDMPFFESFQPYVLQLSILICVVEIVLGVAVIVGGKIKLASWALVLMMVFFTWLTYYTFSCVETNELLTSLGEPSVRDCVTDCGCFGDALRGSVGRSLTPYESFWKDIVLFYFVIIIFLNQNKIKLNNTKQNWVMTFASLVVVIFFSGVFGWYFPIIFYIIAMLGAFIFGNMNIGTVEKAWKMASYVTIISLLFALVTTLYLPVKDYRPYKIGNNISDEMNSGSAQIADYKVKYKNIETGEETIFELGDNAIYGDKSKYEFVEQVVVVIEAGVDPTIMDFILSTDYENLTENEKNDSSIAEELEYNFESYYEEKLIIKSDLGIDTINKYNYLPFIIGESSESDTIFFEKVKEYTGLINPTSNYQVDVTNYILNLNEVVLITIRDIEDMRKSSIADIKEIYNSAIEKGIPFYILSPAGSDQIKAFKDEFEFSPAFLSMDGTEIKIIVRSNPGLVILKKGTVIDKWGARSIPDFLTIQEKLK